MEISLGEVHDKISPEVIVEFLRLIRNKLTKGDSETLEKILSEITMEGSFCRCLELLSFKKNLSVPLIKKALRCVMLMVKYPGLCKRVISKLYPDIIHGKHLRVMVLGNHNVGKTSLVDQLCNIKDSRRFVGIDVKQCFIDDRKNWYLIDGARHDNQERVSVWDFSGQSLYYAIHHFFLVPKAAYLLVLDLSKDLYSNADDSESFEENDFILPSFFQGLNYIDSIKFWIQNIYHYTSLYSNGEGTENAFPRVVLVGILRKGLTNVNEGIIERSKREYFDTVLRHFRGTDYLNIIDEEMFFIFQIDDAATRKTLQDMRDRLRNISLGDTIQSRDINAVIGQLRKEKISLTTDLSKTCGDSPNFQSLLKTQHELGHIYFFSGIVFVDPNYLLDIIKLFVTKRTVCMNQRENWWQFLEGMLNESLICEFFKDTEFSLFKSDILQLLESLDFIVKPFEEPGQLSFFIVPCLLPVRIDETVRNMLNESNVPKLCIEIEEDFHLKTFYKFLSTLCRNHNVKRKGRRSQPLLFKDFGLFELDSQTQIEISYNCVSGSKLYIMEMVIKLYERKHERRKPKMNQTWKPAFEKYMEALYNASQRKNSKNMVNIELYIDCPRCENRKDCKACRDLWDMERTLQPLFSFDIEGEINTVDLSFTDKYSEMDFESLRNHKPSEQDLVEIINCLSNYRKLAIDLGIRESEVNGAEMKYKHISEATVKFHVLYEWKKRGKDLYALCQAMHKNGCNVANLLSVIKGCDSKEIDQKTKEKLEKLQGFGDNNFTDKKVVEIVNCIGDEFWILGIRLGIEETKLQQIAMNYEKKETIIKEMLGCWIKMDGQPENLIRALIKCNSRTDCIINVLLEKDD